MTVKSLVAAGPYLIHQNYEKYTPEDHDTWAELVRRQRPQIEQYACSQYLEGFEIIGLQEHRLPNLAAISRRLTPRTGWSTTPVSGFLPADAFFEMLAARMFPTTTYVRNRESLEYTPQPDIFHDVFGHVPMHAHRVFADFLQHYGAVCKNVSDANVLERLGRLFWYTVEFGLIRQDGMVKFYGSGVISSRRESLHVIDGRCEVRDFDLDEVLATPVKVDEVQKKLFAIESFDQVYDAMHEAESRVESGAILGDAPEHARRSEAEHARREK